MHDKYTAEDLLRELNNKGFTTDAQISDFVINNQQEKILPLYLIMLTGIGAFIASICLIGFLVAAEIVDYRSNTQLIISGIIFILAAIWLKKVFNKHKEIYFLIQYSFTCMMLGKILFVIGFSQMLDFSGDISIALFLITVITYNIYQMSIDRFLSSFAVLLSALLYLIWNYDIIIRELLLNMFFFFQFIGLLILFINKRVKQDYIPLSYAFVFSLCSSTILLASHTVYWQNSYFINITLTSGLIFLFGWIVGDIKKLKTNPLISASLGTIILGLISAPGILLAILLMVLGYTKYEKPLIIIGSLLTPVFLFLYYYNLDISFMVKAEILMGTGIILLIGRVYMHHKGWDIRGLPCEKK